MNESTDRAIAPLGAADGPPTLAGLFAVTGIAAITADTAPEEVAARLEALRRRLALARTLVITYLRDAGWPDPEGIVRRALAEPGTLEAASAPAPRPLPLAVRYPALTLWQGEVRAGRRTAGRLDALWRAATWEHGALDAERDGLPDTAAARMRRAHEVLAEAPVEEARDCAA